MRRAAACSVFLLACGARSALRFGEQDAGIPDAGACSDLDMDGLGDRLERDGDTDGDGTDDVHDADDDGDGLSTSIERGDGDPCTPPESTDCDETPDYLDLDSDADGVLDAEELEHGTDASLPDTDADGLPDGAEILYGSNPLDASSALDANDFFTVLPFEGPRIAWPIDVRQDESADVLFLVDTTGSMSAAIEALQDGLSDTILPGLEAAIPDLHVGVAEFEDFAYAEYGQFCGSGFYGGPDRGKDHAYNLLQGMTDVTGHVNAALNDLNQPMGCGGDGPEAYVEALYQAATGEGIRRTDVGEDFAAPVVCEDATRVGGACFRIGSLPILLLVGDNEFHNGPPDGAYAAYTEIPIAQPQPHTWPQAIDALGRMGARVIGLLNSTSLAGLGDEHMIETANATGALDAGGEPLFFTYAPDGTGLDDTVVEAVEALVRVEPHDLSTRTEDTVDDDVDATRFVVDVTTVSATPPDGVSAMDAHTFYDVRPGTTVEFEVLAENAFFPEEESSRFFLVVVVVLADGLPRFGGRRLLVEVPPAC